MSSISIPPTASLDGSDKRERVFHPKFAIHVDDCDVLVQSSDDVVFTLHRKNIDIIMGAFPVEPDHTDETIGVSLFVLEEPGYVLENVLQFLYPMKPSFPENLPFEHLMQIAEAAEKYEVFTALPMCDTHIRKHIPRMPKETLAYALKYNHTALVDVAAFHCVLLPLSESITVIPAAHIVTWIAYHEEWQMIFKKRRTGRGFCEKCVRGDYILTLENKKSLLELRKTLSKHIPRCDPTRSHASFYNLEAVNTAILDSIEKFPAFTKFQGAQKNA